MSNTLLCAAASRRMRAASPALHGGASSLLRLARGGDARLPSGAALSGWAERAAAMLDLTPMMVGTLASARPETELRELPSLRHAARGVGA